MMSFRVNDVGGNNVVKDVVKNDGEKSKKGTLQRPKLVIMTVNFDRINECNLREQDVLINCSARFKNV